MLAQIRFRLRVPLEGPYIDHRGCTVLGAHLGGIPQKVKFWGFSIFSKSGPTIFPKLRQTVALGVPLTHKKFGENRSLQF